MHAGVLDVLGDCDRENSPLGGHRVGFELLRAFDELRDDHGMLARNLGRPSKGRVERRPVVGDPHGRTGQDVGRPHEHGVPDAPGEASRLAVRLHLGPRRLGNVETVQE